jgi:hypothetical protein
VDESAEDVTSPNGSHAAVDGMWVRRGELKAAVGTSPVVVADVLGEDPFQLASGEHEQVIEAVFSDRAHPSFGVGIRSWRSDRSPDGLGADRGEDVVEAGGELGVAVTDEEPHSSPGVLEVTSEVAGDLGDPHVVGIGGDPRRCTTRRSISITNSA